MYETNLCKILNRCNRVICANDRRITSETKFVSTRFNGARKRSSTLKVTPWKKWVIWNSIRERFDNVSISDVISRFRWIFRHGSKFVTLLLLLLLLLHGSDASYVRSNGNSMSNGFHLTVPQAGIYQLVFIDHSRRASLIYKVNARDPRCTISVFLGSFMYLCVSLLSIRLFS